MTTTPFTAIIVDDEPLAVEGVRRLCAASELVSIVGEACDGPSALALIERLAPQAVFLDIAMPRMSGLSVAATLKRLSRPPQVVLVTANDNFATEAFDLGVVDYVLKPIDPERLTRAIERVGALMAKPVGTIKDESAIWVPYRGTVVRLAIRDILRIEAERDYVRVYDVDRSYLMRATMSDITERMSEFFVRVHRSTLLAREQICGIRHTVGGSWIAFDPKGNEFPIGRTYLATVRRTLGIE